MEIPKAYINTLRHTLKEIIKKNEEFLQELEESYMEYKYTTSGITGFFLKKDILDSLNRRYKTNFTVSTSFESIRKWYLEKRTLATEDNERLKTILDSLTKNGFIKPCFNFPRIMLSFMVSDTAYQYLILTGIKMNGENLKKPSYLFNDYENKLVLLEKEMANLLDDSYQVKIEDRERFADLYRNYLAVFVKYLDDVFGNTYQIPLEKRIDFNIENMLDYFKTYKATLKVEETPKESKRVKKVTSVINPLDGYILNGKVVKVCGIEEFRVLLDKTNLTENRKQEYLAQMINLAKRLENEEMQRKLEEIKKSIFSEEELVIYEQAKISNNKEATQIIKDINALLELFLDVTDNEERKELLIEAESLMASLKRILHFNFSEDDELIKPVLYYKNSNLVPYIEEGINSVYPYDYKSIYQDLMKIIDGNTTRIRELKGNLPVRVYIRGVYFKIFYSIINGIPLIIYGGSDKNIYQKVQGIVNNKNFMEYLNMILADIKNGKTLNDNEYTKVLIEKLKNNRGLI